MFTTMKSNVHNYTAESNMKILKSDTEAENDMYFITYDEFTLYHGALALE